MPVDDAAMALIKKKKIIQWVEPVGGDGLSADAPA